MNISNISIKKKKKKKRETHPRPATPLRMMWSEVRVPVLSKQQTSTLPANGMRKGSVQ